MSNRKGSVPTSGPKVPSITIDHGTSQSSMSAYDKNVLSPNLRSNSLQRRSAIHTHYGKSPVSLSPHDQTIKFDYNVFVTTWQDQIKMRQYDNCEKYCREVIDKLLAAEDQQQLVNAFGNFTANNLNKTKSEPYTNNNNNYNNDNNNELEDEDLHTLLEYRSKVHFSLAYLLKKYFKRYDEAREQYQESIKTDRENPGAHFNLANMLVDHYRDYETAQYHFEKAIALEPTYSLYRMTYAEFLWHDCDRYKQSAIQYEELIKSNKDNEDIFFNYGLLLRDHLKNIPKAMEQFKCVMKLNPDDNEAIEEYNYTKSLNKKNTKKINIQMDPNDNMDEKEKNDKVVFNGGDLNKIDFSQLGSYDNIDESSGVKDTNSKQKRLEYQNNRKKNSNFRKSQHEINLNSLNDDESYALKYHQIMDEKNKLNIKLQEKEIEVNKQNDNLLKIKEILRNNKNFKKELAMMVQNGANYVEVNAKNAHKLLSMCHGIIQQLDGMEITKDDDGNMTPIVPKHYNGGHKRDPSVV